MGAPLPIADLRCITALRRVCSYCGRLIMPDDSPGKPAGAATAEDSHGACRDCQSATIAAMHSVCPTCGATALKHRGTEPCFSATNDFVQNAKRWLFNSRSRRTAADEPVEFRQFQGLMIGIENPNGSIRRGVDGDGKPWATKMDSFSYGYICAATIPEYESGDGDSVDCFLNEPPDEGASHAYVILVRDLNTNKVDEPKVFLGFSSIVAAIRAFKRAYNNDRFYFGTTPVAMVNFREAVQRLRKKQKAVGKNE